MLLEFNRVLSIYEYTKHEQLYKKKQDVHANVSNKEESRVAQTQEKRNEVL